MRCDGTLHTRHAADRPHGRTLNEQVDDRGALGNLEPVHVQHGTSSKHAMSSGEILHVMCFFASHVLDNAWVAVRLLWADVTGRAARRKSLWRTNRRAAPVARTREEVSL